MIFYTIYAVLNYILIKNKEKLHVKHTIPILLNSSPL
jgi:hypothetical protein